MILLASPPPPALRAPVQEIVAPKGWRREPDSKARLRFVRPEATAQKRLDLLLFPEEDASGDLKAWLARQARGLGLREPKPQEAEGIAFVGGIFEGRPMLLGAVRPLGSKDRARLVAYIAEREFFETYAGDFASFVEALGKRAADSDLKAKAASAEWAARVAAFPISDRAKPLPAADAGGVKAYSLFDQVYTVNGTIDFVWRPLLLFPDGTALSDVPSEPVPAFTPGALAKAVDSTDVGRWKVENGSLALTWPARGADERVQTLRRVGEGWTDDPEATEASDKGVYRRVGQLTPKDLQGRWQANSYATSQPGPIPFGGLSVSTWSGRLAFEGDRYLDETEGFRYVQGDSESRSRLRVAGRFRMDGPVLTREFPDGAGGFRRGFVVGYLIPTMPGDDSRVPYLAGRTWVPASKE